ncbi:MAG: hypothetical protein CM15mP62_28440 [Rhodospirillaceae bacterium]|nr:MAG: hypothetical protein CM15mP62_28440 [Rhodospirillaceae bacterium]
MANGFFPAVREHWGDVGGAVPGSMGDSSEIYQEGIRIPPLKNFGTWKINQAVWKFFCLIWGS